MVGSNEVQYEVTILGCQLLNARIFLCMYQRSELVAISCQDRLDRSACGFRERASVVWNSESSLPTICAFPLVMQDSCQGEQFDRWGIEPHRMADHTCMLFD